PSPTFTFPYTTLFRSPIEVNAGVRIPSLSFWREIFKTCHEHGILTIADEVFTGLGRTGKFLGIDNFGVEPDIVCFGKGVGGTLRSEEHTSELQSRENL